MSIEYINRISVKKNGTVTISTKSSNDTAAYHATEIKWLSEAYQKHGQVGVDIAMVELLNSCCEIRGNHKSILPYKNYWNHTYCTQCYKDYLDTVNTAWELLTEEDQKSRYTTNETQAFKDYEALEKVALQQMCQKQGIFIHSQRFIS